jgi:hypothetical protein
MSYISKLCPGSRYTPALGENTHPFYFQCEAAIVSQPLIPSTLIERMYISVQDTPIPLGITSCITVLIELRHDLCLLHAGMRYLNLDQKATLRLVTEVNPPTHQGYALGNAQYAIVTGP